ncbi:MAG: hypothetical protein HY055_07570 [Magnetospirillum sp.]|nr:hypothetical protein [Magnetospirillum sp.]
MWRGAVLILCLLGLAVSPAMAEDKAGESSTLDDIVDGIGGVFKVLVGPPISSPSPYLNLPGASEADTRPGPARPPEPKGPADKPAEASEPPPAAPVPAAIIIPAPAAPSTAPAAKPAPVKVVSPPAVSAPPPRPMVPAAAVPVPAPAVEPSCPRAAATATIEQMRRLPSCK